MKSVPESDYKLPSIHKSEFSTDELRHSSLVSSLNNSIDTQLVPYENEDFSFNLLNPLDMETSFQTANNEEYLEEKDEYLNALNSRIMQIKIFDDHRNDQKRHHVQQKYLDLYQAKSETLRKYASKELHSKAMHHVTRVEEQLEREEKKSIKLAQQRERRVHRASLARAERDKALELEDGNKEAGDDKSKINKRATPSSNLRSRPRRSVKSAESAPSTPSSKSKLRISGIPSSTSPESKESKVNGREASSESKSNKEPVTKVPVVRPPSQKEVRALARQYQNTYDAIWRDTARRDANKMYRLAHSSLNIRMSNSRKTSILAAKEARRWQFKTTKSIKDLQMKAKRGMREMLTFWRRNEREERELRKKAEKEAQDQAKKEEEAREARRQARKLNFLISQTELYTHFIARKIDSSESKEPETKNVADLDFDAAGDDELQKAAMANAKKAFQDTQKRAKNFNNDSSELKKVDIDSEEMNFQNPTSLGDIQIPQPKILSCQLKEYQIKGLSWLANLYEQGINGILADEMGLGKTVQSISVMAYLAETYNIWGPFLVVSPASTLHNWQQEIAKFVPSFKVLPYWGNGKDRKVLRKFWDHKNVKYNRDSQFHVLVTSYQLVVADASYFQKIKWQYMILDEAQAIKSSSSSRWKSLLSFQCRNRLLLTGTPIQNSMQELWALLHFIMPSLFDSHDEFSDWFSNDIESHAQSNTQLNKQQLTRLHMILKPFMLRRLKKHVQSELGDKIEEDIYCKLTNRQRMLYKTLRSQISLMDLIEKAASGSDDGTQSLMNLVMQFRKVCNHPDLFDRADVMSPFSFGTFGSVFGTTVRDGPQIDVYYTAQNHISFNIPKLLYRQGGFLEIPSEQSPAGFRSKYINNLLNIWTPEAVSNSLAFSWMRLIDYSPNEISKVGTSGLFERSVSRFSYGEQKSSNVYSTLYDEDDSYFIPHSNLFLINEQQQICKTPSSTGILNSLLNIGTDMLNNGIYNSIEPAFGEPALCPPIELTGPDRSIALDQQNLLFKPECRSVLYPMTLDQEWNLFKQGIPVKEFPSSNMLPVAHNRRMGFNNIRMPSMTKFVTDSGKLSKLDEMLPVLKAQDHRVLIYFQMTKMMDLMEEYLTFRQYKYCRLDGSSKLSDRRDLVNDWQTKPELFVFLLSTRAGGLGINLTAADTVIFYDSDWNPTIDSQAMDRAHRMGQTRQVTVYRLLVKGTIEERMRDRAKQKMHVQQVVMEGGSGSSGSSVDFQKPGREVAYWLLDDDATADAMIAKKQSDAANGKNGKASRGGNKRGAGEMEDGNLGGPSRRKIKTVDEAIEDMYHEGEGNFDESSQSTSQAVSPSVSGTTTPVRPSKPPKPGRSRRRMNTEQRLNAVGSGNF